MDASADPSKEAEPDASPVREIVLAVFSFPACPETSPEISEENVFVPATVSFPDACTTPESSAFASSRAFSLLQK